MAGRTPDEIRASIEANRTALARVGREAARRGRRDHRLAQAAQRAPPPGAARRRRRRLPARRRAGGASAPPAPLSAGAAQLQQPRRHAADAEQPRAGVGADHRPDLRDPLRLAAEQLAAALDQLGGALGRLDVLDDPAVGALVAARAHVVDHPLERAPGGADALDRRDLGLEREDRLDLQRAAQPGLRAADAPAALQVGERVDAEPDRAARRAPRARARARPSMSPPARAAAAAASTTQPRPPQAVAASSTAIRPASPALVEQRLGLRGRADGAGDAAGEVDRDDVVAGRQQRLVDGEEVADRRLRGRRQRRGSSRSRA